MSAARSSLALASLVFMLSAARAEAGRSVCWVQNGVLLVPAVAAGVNGVFILDTGAAHSQLDATQASEVDIGDAATMADIHVAGRTFPAVPMRVIALDDRTRAFPTPIAGVLGADILVGQVLEVRMSPCRLNLSPSRPGSRRGLPIEIRGGVPFVRAAASDGTISVAGAFRIDTGSPAPAMLAGGSVTTPNNRLRALSFGDRLFENLAAIKRPEDADGAGAIGEPIWSRFDLRLDFCRRILALEPVSPRPGPKGRSPP
ncbi:MAG TPA: hypothetical protein VHY32_00100 [Caulobacteraceae bacterium]|jgi:hypothetical protein|nr:hypothetical protein [Caulobacteraceae bacterium]